MPLALDELPAMFSAWRERYAERDDRMQVLDAVVRGDFTAVDPDGAEVENRSPNLVQVALEDTAEAASLLPTIRVSPSRLLQSAKAQAARMEKVAVGYLDAARKEELVTTTLMDLAGFGFGAWVVWPDFDQKLPIIEKRDPRHCYPEPGHRPGDKVRRCMFARQVYVTQLPPEYRARLAAQIADSRFDIADPNTSVTLVEYYDEEELVVAGLYESSPVVPGTGPSVPFTPALLDTFAHNLGVCPVVVGSRFTLDGEFRGQFDQVVGPLMAHVRLMGLVLDYADQAVYSDVWVRDLIGEMPYGGGAYIELGPQGAIGRVPPAVSSLDVQRDLEALVDGIHLGGRWPKTRPGEIDQAIASAKFVEATAGMMNTAIKTYHVIMKRMLEQALRIAFTCDKKWFPGPKTVSGVLRNQEFIEEYDASKDINLDHPLRVEYGLGLGRDPAQSAVLMLQYAGNEYISHEYVQENLEGLADVTREQARIDTQKFREMALAKLLQGLEAGTIPNSALVEIAEAREKGESLFDLYRKYVAEPEEQAMEQQLGSGLGPPVMPGVDPAAAGIPGAEPPEGAASVPAPPPPDMAGMLSRLTVNAGPGAMIGTQLQGERPTA